MEALIANYSGLVFSIARRYVRDNTAAEDVVQEVFAKIWSVSGKFDPSIASEKSFIAMIARRKAIDVLRKDSRRPQGVPLPEPERIPDYAEQARPWVACDQGLVDEALSELPEDTEKLFRLHFHMGMTHPEIARQMGMPLGTVKTKLRRGLIRLREEFRRLDGSGGKEVGAQ